jgi:ABC-type branched-subunit amino acid transport system ATPase component
MLAVARALVATPRLLVLDEPSAGLSPLLVGVVFEQLRRVRESGVTILLVEQNVKAALALADRAVVLVEGRERLEGPGRRSRHGSAPRRTLSRRRGGGSLTCCNSSPMAGGRPVIALGAWG